jgi:hypothetical protein
VGVKQRGSPKIEADYKPRSALTRMVIDWPPSWLQIMVSAPVGSTV